MKNAVFWDVALCRFIRKKKFPDQAQMHLKQFFGNSVQLTFGIVNAFTEQRDASASVDPAGGVRVYIVLELKETGNGAMAPASKKERKGTQWLGLLSL
jgi:hypothetical protein